MKEALLAEIRSSPATAVLLLLLLGGNGTDWVQRALAPPVATAAEVDGGWSQVYDEVVEAERSVTALRRELRRMRAECRAGDDLLSDGEAVEEGDL
jgi:hypothetical protein